MLALLSLNIIIAIVCAGSMSFLFPLFNMIQLIVLLPLLEVNLPENLQSFIDNYLQFANFKFDFLVNPFHRWNIIDLSEVVNNPLNKNFEENEVNSRVLIVTYGGQLIIWTVIALLYFPILFCAKICGCKKFKELKKAYEFGVLFTSFSEAFVEFTLLSFLNIYQVIIYIYIYIYKIEFKSKASTFASIFGLAGMFLSCGFIVIVLNILSNLGKNLKKEENLERFGSIYSDTNYNSHIRRRNLAHYYIIVFLMRRFLYVFIILFLFKYPIFQQVSNIILHLLTFLYDIIMCPYPLGILGVLIYFFDFILALIFGSLPLYIAYPNKAEQIGRIHIYILIATIAISWIIIIGINIRTIYVKIKEAKAKKEEKNEPTLVDKYLNNKVSLTTLAKITGRRTNFVRTTPSNYKY